MLKNPRPGVPVFEIKKKFSWKETLLRLLEVVLIVVVIGGTAFWLLLASGFSFEKLFSDFLGKLKPAVTLEQNKSFEDSGTLVKNLIDEYKIFEVGSVRESGNDSLEVTSKNNILVIFSLKKDLSGQVRTLQTVSTKAKIENRNLKKVDFRFEKIIVES